MYVHTSNFLSVAIIAQCVSACHTHTGYIQIENLRTCHVHVLYVLCEDTEHIYVIQTEGIELI